MRSHTYYDITALPALGELGSVPPVEPARLLEHLADNPRCRTLVEVILLRDDLLAREALLCGEAREIAPIVLSPAQARGEAPLPAYLAGPSPPELQMLEADTVWNVYFHHAARLARALRSPFLTAWVAYEVGLRNALAAARAERLGLDVAGYLVAAELAAPAEQYDEVVGAWAVAETPLAGLRAVIECRWAWLGEHDAWFSFRDDEFAVYAARLILLRQWRRLILDERRQE